MKNIYRMNCFFLIASIFCKSLLPAAEINQEYPVVIIGGGIGALTSAIYMSRAGIAPLVIEGDIPGGAISQSPIVQNWPGEVEISGSDLVDKIRQQAHINGAIFSSSELIDIDFAQKPYSLTLRNLYDADKIVKIKAKSVIIALGSKPNFLNVPGETEYWTKGVYNCAVCDGGLYKNKVVAVVGGGDAAITEAVYLSNIAKKVYVLVRKKYFRCVEENRKQELLNKPNIEVCFDTTVKEILGEDQRLTHAILENAVDGKRQSLELDAIFLAIGARPNSFLFKDKLELDPNGYIVLKKGQETSQEGVFAMGDIVDPVYKQAISAAGDAAKAALQAERYLSSIKNIDSSQEQRPDEKKTALKECIADQAFTEASKKKHLKEITSIEQFDAELQKGQPVLIDFYATWCGPCRQFSPTFESWSKEYGTKVKFLKVNVDNVPILAQIYKISSLPTLIILDKEGNLYDKKTGTKEIYNFGDKISKLVHEKGKSR